MKYVGIQPLDTRRLSLALEKSFSQIRKFWFKYVQTSHVGERKGEGWLGRVFLPCDKSKKKMNANVRTSVEELRLISRPH